MQLHTAISYPPTNAFADVSVVTAPLAHAPLSHALRHAPLLPCCLTLRFPQWPYVPWGHNFMAFDVAFTPDGSRLAVGYSDWTAKVWDLASGSCSYTLEVSSLGLLSLHCSHTAAVPSIQFTQQLRC